MIRINLAKKKSGGGGGGGQLDLKNFKLSNLVEMLKGGGDGERKFDLNGPIPKAVLCAIVAYYVGDTIDGYKAEELHKVDVQIQKVETDKNGVAAKLAKIKGFEPIKKQLEDDEKAIRLKLDVVRKLLDDRNAASKMMMQIAQSIPEEVWLKTLDVTEDSVKLGGETQSYNQVSDFIKNLNSTSQFSDISLSGIQEGSGDLKDRIQRFDLTAKRRRN